MPERHAEDDLMDDLAEEFARRLRAGERPSVEEFAARHPDRADEVRDVLEAVEMMERLKPRPEDVTPVVPYPGGPECVPERIGDYRVVREIGRGGMGVVYEAVQEPLGRRVALKVLPAHLLADEKLRARFRREAQAAARLHHTNIVPVYGSGESDGLCYYVMQLIDGRGLDRLIRAAAAAPADRCRGAARIAAQVADALEYAHSQGVLHRDVKPANLILDEHGMVWVTDFGVAKLVEEVDLTKSGDLVGTLKYVPPERFAGRSDARGDVYSLGVTLYEMITLRAAFPDSSPQHLIHLITTQAKLLPPRRINRAVPADLETVVLKAIARDPAHRYQTPGEMAEDLRRFLDDRPIRARRAGPVERARRWCRRNPALAASAAAIAFLMLAVTAVSVAGYVRTSAANYEARKALAAEKAQREQAEEVAALALATLNRTFDQFAPARLVATPQAAAAEGVELPPQPSLPPEAVPLLEDLLRNYEQVARAGAAYPRLQGQAGEANHRIGDLHQRLGRHEQAVSAYRAAIALYEGLPAGQADGATRIKLARSRNELGRALRALRRLDEAERQHRLAVQALADAPAALAARPECRFELARSYYLLGLRDTLDGPGPGGEGPPKEGWRGEPPDRKGRDRPPPPPPPDEAPDSPARRAAELLEALVSQFPRVPEYRHLLACCYRDLPPPPPRGRPPEGKPKPDRAVDLLRELAADFPRVPDYRLDLCDALARRPPPGHGDGPDREGRMQEAIDVSKELAEQYPNVPEYAAAHARYLDLLGVAKFESGRPHEAERLHRRAIAAQVKLVRQYPDVVAYAFWLCLMERSLGRALSERGEQPEAITWQRSAIERAEKLAKKHPGLAGARPFLGMAYRELGQSLARSGQTAAADEARRKAEEYGPPGPGGPKKRDRP